MLICGPWEQEQSHVPRGLDYAPSVAREPELTRHPHSAAAAAGSSGVLKDHCRFNLGCSKVRLLEYECDLVAVLHS